MKNPKPMIAAFVIALLAVGGIVAFRLNRDDGRRSDRGAAAGSGVTGASVQNGEGPVVVRSRNDRVPAFTGDAGAAAAPELVRRPTPIGGVPGGSARVAARAQAEADDAERSNGWRAGQRRRQVEVLEARVERLREAVGQLREEGRSDLADRQQSIVERIDARADEVREELGELRAAAQADGTLAEAEQGYEDSAPVRNESRARGAIPGR
ncbi:MAG: hypothetical protein AB8I08_10700 [Sandaracinaceae bacterium]